MAAVYPAAALVLARVGRAREAKVDSLHAEQLLEMSPEAPPWLAVEAQILLSDGRACSSATSAARGPWYAPRPARWPGFRTRQRSAAGSRRSGRRRRWGGPPSRPRGIADHGPALPPDPPLVPADRRPAVRLPLHGQEPGPVGVPEARRLMTRRGRRARARAGAPGLGGQGAPGPSPAPRHRRSRAGLGPDSQDAARQEELADARAALADARLRIRLADPDHRSPAASEAGSPWTSAPSPLRPGPT
jgi:hypothetical protein